MAPSSALRSFATALAIVIAIIEPKASGFAIDRNSSTEKPQTTNLFTDDSMQLNVKNDLRIHNSNEGEKVEDLSIHKLNKNNYNNNNITTDIITTVSEENSKNTTDSVQEITEATKTTDNVKFPTISSDTIEVFDSTEDAKEQKIQVETATSILSTEKIYQPQNYTRAETVLTIATTETPIETSTSVVLATVTDQLANETVTIQGKSTKHVVDSFVTDYNRINTERMNNGIDNDQDKMSTSTIATKASAQDIIPTSTDLTNDDFSTTMYISTKENTTSAPDLITPFLANTKETTTDDTNNATTTETSWKKYTTIDRKQVTIEAVSKTTAEHEEMKAETSNSHANFNKAYSITSIPSLEKLRADLMYTANPAQNTKQMISEETAETTMGMESSIPSMNTIINDDSKRTGIVDTKRGGFLDFSEKLTTPITNEFITIAGYYTDHDVNLSMIEIEAPKLALNKENSSESQSQLAEDAIQEELLKEEALNNQQENVKRYGEERDDHRVKPLDGDKKNQKDSTSTSGDSLSVQPINYERMKTTLYTVNPNYKPMKKIDVQPAKPFVRDPDDNSWRNESISSLGIVFKPNNASKSFKEVLKNKTHIELSNLQEKDSKDDVPDLRVRLEKIAQVRKTKKKKTNKDGLEVYTDYEEASAEISKETTTTPRLTSAGLTLAIPTLTTPKSMQTETVRRSSTVTSQTTTTENTMSKLDFFRNFQALETLTTEKAKKFFNIAEYYDTTDEYDADYVTMSKIDLKKQFSAPRTTERPPTTTHTTTRVVPTESTKPQFPERKPTVQYFPPRTTHRVNFNNLDADFERKINLFTFKDHSYSNLRPTIAPEPTSPVATDQPEPNTVKSVSVEEHANTDHNTYTTTEPRPPSTRDENFNRGSYIIKHYKDFLTAAGKDDDDRGPDFVQYASRPASQPPVTPPVGFYVVSQPAKDKRIDYYDLQLRQDVLNRFVDNFNQNSERFKVDFPILYNNSVVHRAEDNERGVASSRTLLKRVYGDTAKPFAVTKKPCEPDCVTVELSPAYELHYYVPDQEETEEIQRPAPYPGPMHL